jgi:hypothetical protein
MISKRFLQLVHVLVHPFKVTQTDRAATSAVGVIGSRRQD